MISSVKRVSAHYRRPNCHDPKTLPLDHLQFSYFCIKDLYNFLVLTTYWTGQDGQLLAASLDSWATLKGLNNSIVQTED